jgi:hypothetical protein
LVTLGSATTAPDGRYGIRIPDGLLAPEATGGVVNLEADSGGGSAFFPVAIRGMPGNASIAAVAHPTAANIAALSPSASPAHCGIAYERSLGKHWTRVGQTLWPGRTAACGVAAGLLLLAACGGPAVNDGPLGGAAPAAASARQSLQEVRWLLAKRSRTRGSKPR